MTGRPLTLDGARDRIRRHAREAATWHDSAPELAWPRAMQAPGLCAAVDRLQLELGDDEGQREALAIFVAQIEATRSHGGKPRLSPGEDTIRLTVAMPVSVRAQLDAIAAREDVRVAEVARRYIEAGIAGDAG